jgi:hypothetical protein
MITPSFGLTATERVLPRLALDFTTAVLDSRITFTRTGNTATRVNSSGFVESVNADVARFDFDPVTLACKGLLIEETRANLCLQSNDHNTTPWVRNSAGTGLVPAITLNNAISPDGTQNATKLVFNVGAGTTTSDQSNWFQPKVLTAASYTGSLWVRGDAGGEQIYFRDPAAGYQLLTLTTNWQRISFTATGNTSDVVRIGLAIRQGIGGVTINQTATVYVYGGQIELGAFATSYIPTTTTALTRNADVATMTGTNFSDWFNASEGTFVAYINTGTNPNQTDASGVARGALCANDGTTSNRFRVGLSITGFAVVTGGSTVASIVNIGSVASNTNYKFSCGYKTNYFQVAKNTTLGTAVTSGAVPSGLTTVELGRSSSGGVGNLCGYLQKIMYYPYELSNAELQSTSK